MARSKTAADNPRADQVVLSLCLVAILVIAFLPLSLPAVWHYTPALFSLALVAWARVPVSHLLSRGLLMLPALLAALLILPLVGPPPYENFLGLTMSRDGMARAFATSQKLVAITAWLSLLTWRLPPQRILLALEGIHAPGWLVQILKGTYRNLVILSREVASMRRALKSRIIRGGLWLGKAGGNMVGLLFMRTRTRAEAQEVAGRARDLGDSCEPAPDPPSVQISNLSFRYSGADEDALQGICLDIPPGEKVALLGCNGAGKTTLLFHLNAVLPIQSGQVSVCGIPVGKKTRHRVRREVGMLFQNPDDQILGLTVEEDVAIGPDQLGIERDERDARVEQVLRQVGLWKKRAHPPHQLSGGERKRLALAGVIAYGARILLLDEPMAALDPPGRDTVQVLLDDLHREGRTVIFATHDLQFAAQWATMVVLMDSGHLAAAGSPGVLQDRDLLASVGMVSPLN